MLDGLAHADVREQRTVHVDREPDITRGLSLDQRGAFGHAGLHLLCGADRDPGVIKGIGLVSQLGGLIVIDDVDLDCREIGFRAGPIGVGGEGYLLVLLHFEKMKGPLGRNFRG